MREGPLWAGGAIRDSRLTGESVTRLPARAPVTVGGSEGVVVGDGATQRNKFIYRLKKPQLNMSAAICARPELARKLAVAIRHPRAKAAQRSFARELGRMFGQATGQAGELRADHGLPVINIVGSDGVMVGTGNTRIDVVRRMVEGRFEVRGWDAPDLHPKRPVPPALPLLHAVPPPLVPGRSGPGLPVPTPDPGRSTRILEVSLVPPLDGTSAAWRRQRHRAGPGRRDRRRHRDALP